MNNTFENNKLISVFMGFETYPDIIDDRTMAYDVGDYIKFADNSTNENDENIFHPDDMQFHKSWDWLMPVVRECRVISHSKDENWEAVESMALNGSINKTYNAVIKLIKVHNRRCFIAQNAASILAQAKSGTRNDSFTQI